MHEILRNNLETVERICRSHHVKRLYAFGSVCSDKFNENSDIDLIISFTTRFFDGYVDNFFSLEEKLENILNRKVDLVTEETIENPYFKKVIDETKIPIYV